MGPPIAPGLARRAGVPPLLVPRRPPHRALPSGRRRPARAPGPATASGHWSGPRARTGAGEARCLPRGPRSRSQRLGKGDSPATDKGVTKRHGKHQPVGPKWVAFQLGKIGVIGGHSHVRQPLSYGAGHFDAWPLVKVHVHIGVRGEEGSQRLGQMLGHRSSVGQQANVPLQPVRVLAQLAAHPLHLSHHRPRMVQQRLACRRGPDAAAVAL